MTDSGAPPASRRHHAISAALLALAAGGYVAFALGVRPFARVDTSAVFADDPRFGGRNLVDGDLATEWLPPDTTMAEAHIRYAPSVDVAAVVVHNGQNRPFRDRASQRLDVELYRRGARVHVGTVLFPTMDDREAVLEVRPPARGVDRITVRVRGFHELGAAIAEVAVRTPSTATRR